MAVMINMDMPGITDEMYDFVDGKIDPRLPDGAISHSVHFDDEGMHVVDIWESPEAFQTFAQNQLGATIAEASEHFGITPPASSPQITPLHNALARDYESIPA